MSLHHVERVELDHLSNDIESYYELRNLGTQIFEIRFVDHGSDTPRVEKIVGRFGISKDELTFVYTIPSGNTYLSTYPDFVSMVLAYYRFID